MTEPTWTIEHEYTIPRDISVYEPTNHFMQRLKYRTDPEPSKDIVREVVNDGEIKPTHIEDRFILEKEIYGNVWWVVVKINKRAFECDTKHHALLTIYCKNGDHEKHPTVFDG